jgi:hypothetical protein
MLGIILGINWIRLQDSPSKRYYYHHSFHRRKLTVSNLLMIARPGSGNPEPKLESLDPWLRILARWQHTLNSKTQAAPNRLDSNLWERPKVPPLLPCFCLTFPWPLYSMFSPRCLTLSAPSCNAICRCVYISSSLPYHPSSEQESQWLCLKFMV